MQHALLRRHFRLVCVLAALVGLVCFAAPSGRALADGPYLLSFPLIMNITPEVVVQQAAIERINFYRGSAGVQLVQQHPALNTSAQHHADYDLLNYADPQAWTYGPHGEVVGMPGFTGQTSAERAIAAQFPYAPNGEVIAYFDDPIESSDAWATSVFHRVLMLNPYHQYAGYGHGQNSSEYVDVVDFGRGPTDPTGQPGVIIYPTDGQTDVPLYGASETPSPLPPDASYPIGYPITIQPLYSSAVTVTLAELRDGAGALVDLYPNPARCVTVYGCYALIPTAGLQPATTYTVHVVGDVDGAPLDMTWSFTTKVCSTPLEC